MLFYLTVHNINFIYVIAQCLAKIKSRLSQSYQYGYWHILTLSIRLIWDSFFIKHWHCVISPSVILACCRIDGLMQAKAWIQIVISKMFMYFVCFCVKKKYYYHTTRRNNQKKQTVKLKITKASHIAIEI